MNNMIYQDLTVYAVGIHGYRGHPKSPKYVLILNANRLIGIDQEGRKGDKNESCNLLPGIN